MILEKEIDNRQKTDENVLFGWYKSSERSKHPHPKKLRVECSLDEDVIRWLERKARGDEEYPIYINYYLRKIMDNDFNNRV